jgi:hypothetical protein
MGANYRRWWIESMRHDPIEFGTRGLAAGAAMDRVKRLASRLKQHARQASVNHGAEVVDEAFATFSSSTTRMTRVDALSEPAATISKAAQDASASMSVWEPVKREIVADLTAQLDLLDSQRDRLSRLLRTINDGPIGQ